MKFEDMQEKVQQIAEMKKEISNLQQIAKGKRILQIQVENAEDQLYPFVQHSEANALIPIEIITSAAKARIAFLQAKIELLEV